MPATVCAVILVNSHSHAGKTSPALSGSHIGAAQEGGRCDLENENRLKM